MCFVRKNWFQSRKSYFSREIVIAPSLIAPSIAPSSKLKALIAPSSKEAVKRMPYQFSQLTAQRQTTDFLENVKFSFTCFVVPRVAPRATNTADWRHTSEQLSVHAIFEATNATNTCKLP